MDKILLELLLLVQRFDSLPNYGGMCDVAIKYHPYRAAWEAKTTWSERPDGISSISNTPERAATNLL
jgi:hypothetical protein